MAWEYSGNPASSDKDKYRFLLSDTDSEEPILQDEEVQFILDEYKEYYERLYMLFDMATKRFARQIETKVGPITEKPYTRMKYFKDQTLYYYNKAYGLDYAGPSMKATKPNFRIGMHDNG